MTLYEINQAILDLVDPETGEILDWDTLDQLNLAKEEKLEGVAVWIKNLTAEGAALRVEEVSLAERRKSIERKIERLKKYLGEALDGESFETPKCAVTFRKTTSVELTDVHAAAEWLEDNGMGDLVSYQMPKIGKPDLAKLLKSGHEVPGCELVNGLSMGVK